MPKIYMKHIQRYQYWFVKNPKTGREVNLGSVELVSKQRAQAKADMLWEKRK